MAHKSKIWVLELLIGGIVVVPYLVDVYLYSLYPSVASRMFFTLALPILFAAVVIAGSVYNERSPINTITGIAALITFIVGSGWLYVYFSTTTGVFFGGVITAAVSIGLFACVLLREIYYFVRNQQKPELSS